MANHHTPPLFSCTLHDWQRRQRAQRENPFFWFLTDSESKTEVYINFAWNQIWCQLPLSFFKIFYITEQHQFLLCGHSISMWSHFDPISCHHMNMYSCYNPLPPLCTYSLTHLTPPSNSKRNVVKYPINNSIEKKTVKHLRERKNNHTKCFIKQ